MSKPLTAIHHTASNLNLLIRQRKWHAAYNAADHLDRVINAENWQESSVVHPYCTVSDIAEERFKRAQFQ